MEFIIPSMNLSRFFSSDYGLFRGFVSSMFIVTFFVLLKMCQLLMWILLYVCMLR